MLSWTRATWALSPAARREGRPAESFPPGASGGAAVRQGCPCVQGHGGDRGWAVAGLGHGRAVPRPPGCRHPWPWGRMGFPYTLPQAPESSCEWVTPSDRRWKWRHPSAFPPTRPACGGVLMSPNCYSIFVCHVLLCIVMYYMYC